MNEKLNFYGIFAKCDSALKSESNYDKAFRVISEEFNVPFDSIRVELPKESYQEMIAMNDESFADSFIDHFSYTNNVNGVATFFGNLTNQISEANLEMFLTSLSNSTADISRNPSLSGFLFERYQAVIFNMRARLAGKPYRARVLEPRPGETYAKNSVDIVIDRKNEKGEWIKGVKKYQAKCCKNAEATIQAFEKGDYRNQRLLVCEEQVNDVKAACGKDKTVCSTISYDGVSSNPASYAKMKQLQNAIQNDNWESTDFSEFTTRDIVLAGIESLKAPVVIDLFVRSCFGIAEKAIDDSKAWGEIISDISLGTITDATKMALSTAIKIYGEKKAIEAIQKMTCGQVYAIVDVIVNVSKQAVLLGEGKISVEEAAENVAKSLIVTAARLGGGVAGGALGGLVGLPQVGALAGSFIGGIIGEKGFRLVLQGVEKISENISTGEVMKIQSPMLKTANTNKSDMTKTVLA